MPNHRVSLLQRRGGARKHIGAIAWCWNVLRRQSCNLIGAAWFSVVERMLDRLHSAACNPSPSFWDGHARLITIPMHILKDCGSYWAYTILMVTRRNSNSCLIIECNGHCNEPDVWIALLFYSIRLFHSTHHSTPNLLFYFSSILPHSIPIIGSLLFYLTQWVLYWLLYSQELALLIIILSGIGFTDYYTLRNWLYNRQ